MCGVNTNLLKYNKLVTTPQNETEENLFITEWQSTLELQTQQGRGDCCVHLPRGKGLSGS